MTDSMCSFAMTTPAVVDTSATCAEQSEVTAVLEQYMSMFQGETSQCTAQMAPNGVVDWFGRSIRGHNKIQNCLRYELRAEYQHVNFAQAQSCAPIEFKPTHHKTKTPHAGDLSHIKTLNKVGALSTLKTRADSDIEDAADDVDDDVEMTPLPPYSRTPEKVLNAAPALHCSATITPPASNNKEAPTGSDTETDEECDSYLAAKRLKRTPYSYYRRQTVAAAAAASSSAIKRKLISEAGVRSLLLDVASDDDDAAAADVEQQAAVREAGSEFTSLKYIETTGLLRSQAGNWERPVRMRLSYRRRCNDNLQIQFALVIYEHLDKLSTAAVTTLAPRRNLMLAFSQTDVAEMEEEEFVYNHHHDHDDAIQRELLLGVTTTAASTTTMGEVDPLMATPTKLSNTPPATPKRKPRLPQTLSSLKRFNAYSSSTTTAAATPSPKRNVARSLRL